VRQTVKNEGITGATLEVCAINIVARLGLPSTYYRKAFEHVTRLVNKDEIVLLDAVLRLTTDEERKAMHEARTAMAIRARRTKMRTAAKRTGGHRSLELHTAYPLLAES